MRLRIDVDGRSHEVLSVRTPTGWGLKVDGEQVAVERTPDGFQVGGRPVKVELGMVAGCTRIDGVDSVFVLVELDAALDGGGAGASVGARIRPPMVGRLVRMAVQPGDVVEKGSLLFVLEAMKMQNEVRSPAAGIVVLVQGQAGQAVDPGVVLVELAPPR